MKRIGRQPVDEDGRPIGWAGARWVPARAVADAAECTRQNVGARAAFGHLRAIRLGRERFIEVRSAIRYVRARGREVPTAWLIAAGEAPEPPAAAPNGTAPNGAATAAPPLAAPDAAAASVDAAARSLASALDELERAKRVLGIGGRR